MVTYLQLQSEQVYLDEIVPPALHAFAISVRARYSLPADAVGVKGNNSHLKGRHRSRNWDLQSRYCTDREYGTTDARDKRGDGDWLRAFDAGIRAPELYRVCRRLDAAVRRGELPELAEWFGTFDGQSVVGWFQGHESSSDESHLTHLHGGIWNEHADNAAFYGRLFAVLTGQGMGEKPTMRYVFATDITGGVPPELAGRVHITDGLRYRVVPSSFRIADLLDAAGAGPVVTVTRASLPSGWVYGQAVAALCGAPDPGELAGEGGTAPPVDLEAVKSAAYDGGMAGGIDGGREGAAAAIQGASISLSGQTGTISAAG